MSEVPEKLADESSAPTPLELLNTTARFTQTALDLWLRQVTRDTNGADDPLRIGEVQATMGRALLSDPVPHIAAMVRVQADMWSDFMALGVRVFDGAEKAPVAEPAADDRRFRDEGWSDNALFDLIKQSYLIAGRGIMQLVETTPELDDDERARLAFATAQIVDALAPSNFALTNPQALRAALRSDGRSLLDGLNYFLDDLSLHGQVSAPMAHESHFEVGRDLAVSPGHAAI